MSTAIDYKIGIIGGGLAGLAAAIELRRKGHSVVLFEKKTYPFHKVCGEYLSMESWNYLKFLGLDLERYELPKINRLTISTPSGTQLNKQLEKGGFGISRYLLDHLLFQVAKKEGVEIFEQTEIVKQEWQNDHHLLHSKDQTYKTQLLLGAFGKRSKMDIALNRNYLQSKSKNEQNYIGIKYHLKANLDEDQIGLHLFEGGYCGISKVEGENRYCLCYLTSDRHLKTEGSIEAMEKNILQKNPFLKQYLQLEKFIDPPLSIAQINFKNKSLIEDHLFMLGDAAGMISPLSGNGMSMALHAAHQFSILADEYLKGSISRKMLEVNYKKWWKSQFQLQLKAGKLLQHLFFRPSLIQPILKFLNRSDYFSRLIIRQTHGKDIL